MYAAAYVCKNLNILVPGTHVFCSNRFLDTLALVPGTLTLTLTLNVTLNINLAQTVSPVASGPHFFQRKAGLVMLNDAKNAYSANSGH